MSASGAKKLNTELSHSSEPLSPSDAADRDRAPRFRSHALVDMRLSQWNPFSTVSAVLLDLSWQGFKVEFVNSIKLRPGAELAMIIPLAPFRIQSPSSIKMRVVVKWIDARNFRAGGIFVAQTDQHRHLIDTILLNLSPVES